MDFQALGENLATIVDWVISLGPVWIYLLIIIASFIENIFPPFPGDTVTVAGAALAAKGHLSFSAVFACAYFGGVLSTMLIYYFGRRHGHSYFMNRDFKYFPKNKLVEFENWLQRRGVWLIAGSRFVVGFRTLVALSAGIGRWPVGKMFLFTSFSFWLFNALLMSATYLLVDNLETLTSYLLIYQRYVLALLGLAIAVLIWRALKSRNA